MSPNGPLYGSATAQSGAGVSWTNLSNALVEDGSVATSGFVGPGGGVPNQLNVTGFGFNLPSTAVIDGIKLEIKVQTTGGGAAADGVGGSNGVYLLFSGSNTLYANTPNARQTWPTSALTWLTYGGSTSLWGKSWTYSDINNAAFGASMSAAPGSGSSQINVDSVRVTVYWHPAPADVPKRYTYQSFTSTGIYNGVLPQPTSDFNYSLEINTAGSQISIEVPVSADTASQGVDTLTDESGNILTDESSNTLTDEGQLPICTPGDSGLNALIKNGNKVRVYEYGYWNPNGKLVFQGEMESWEADFGGNGEDKITILCYSDGQDLDNYLVRGNPYTYTGDVTQTSQNASSTLSYTVSKFTSWNFDGQTWKVGVGVTNLGAISLLLNGTANVTLNVYDSPGMATLLGSMTQAVSVSSATEIQFAFPTNITVTAGNTYFFTVSVDAGQSITIYYSNANPYANGAMYNSSYGGGSGSGYTLQSGNDLYFKTFSGTGSTTGTFTSQDPTTGILETVMNDYIARGGQITYTSSTIQATGLSLSYGFNTDTVFSAIRAVQSMSPSGFYWYVDLGTDTLYFKQTNTVADITLVKGRHLDQVKIRATIENIKNTTYFSGGLVTGSNIYVQETDTASLSQYGPRLDRLADNRVTDLATARQIAIANNDTYSSEQYQTTVTVVDKTMDTTLLKPGQVIGFSGFGTFVDNALMQIIRIDYTPEQVTLLLGIFPKRLHAAFDKVVRGIVALNTINNPSVPS